MSKRLWAGTGCAPRRNTDLVPMVMQKEVGHKHDARSQAFVEHNLSATACCLLFPFLVPRTTAGSGSPCPALSVVLKDCSSVCRERETALLAGFQGWRPSNPL